MEVHAHTHTDDPDTHRGKKKWTHYLWEFLMLFLAVFCGFLAENFREHLVEHQRAKQYAQSLLQDLRNDTAEFRNANYYEGKTLLFIDSLIQYSKAPSSFGKSGTLYFYARLATWFYGVDWSRATINQLISSGNLRYFSNPGLVNKISAYNTTYNIIILNETIIDNYRQRAIALRDRLLKAEYYRPFVTLTMEAILKNNIPASIDSLRMKDLPLASKDPELLNSMCNSLINSISNRNQQFDKYYPRAIQQAEEIMELLKKEYNLK